MFDQLPEITVRTKRGRSSAISASLGAHALAVVVIASSSLWALEPIEPPGGALVYQPPIRVVLPRSEPPGARRPPAEKPAPAEKPKTPPTPTQVLQPTAPPEELPPAPPAELVATASTSEGPSELTSPVGTTGTGDGVIGSLGPIDDSTVGAGAPTMVDGVYEIGQGVEPASIIRQVPPRYPELAIRVGVQGRVVIQAVINTEGRLESATVLRGDPLLAPAALAAAERWRFEPGRLNGRKVPVFFTLVVHFKLER